MKSKTKTQSSSTNTYGYMNRPVTEQQHTFDKWAKDAFNQADPTIPYTFNNQREALNNRISNPFGPNYSPEVADAIKYSENQRINQDQGQALREDTHARRNSQGIALGASADAHRPDLVQTGGTQQGTTTHNPGMGNMIMAGISAGAGLGSAAMT